MVGNRSERISALRQQMSPNELVLKDTFIFEYLQDYDAYGASIRSGMKESAAKQYSKSYLSDTYIQLCLAEAELAEKPDNFKAIVAQQIDTAYARVMFNPRVQVKDRIAAAQARATLHGINAPTKTEANLNIRQAVMVVPAFPTHSDWEKMAVANQDTLVREARLPA